MRWRATNVRCSRQPLAQKQLQRPAGKRQGDGRYGVGGGKAERAARFANPLGAGRKLVRSGKRGGTPKASGQSPS